MTRIDRSDGMVLVAALLVMLMMSALGAAFTLVTSSEIMIAANFRGRQEAMHAARAAAERALADLAQVPDWNVVLDGSVRSTFVDGPPSGVRVLADGSSLDLDVIVNQANCGNTSPCSADAMDAVTGDRPRGANNTRWQLYAHGRLDGLPSVDSPLYAIVLAGDDPLEADDDPLRDGLSPQPGAGILVLRAEVFGPRGAHAVVELSVAHVNPSGLRVLSWRF